MLKHLNLAVSQKTVQNSYHVENLYAPASEKWNSTTHPISGIFWNFKNMQGERLVYWLKFSKK